MHRAPPSRTHGSDADPPRAASGNLLALFPTVSVEAFDRAERILHQQLLESRRRFHSGRGSSSELIAALRRFNHLILIGDHYEGEEAGNNAKGPGWAAGKSKT